MGAAEQAAHARGERPGILGPSRWTDIYKPTIAAVNGVAHAGGLEWVCWTAIRTDKEAAIRGFGRPLDEGLRIEAECFNRLIDQPEIRDGVRRFNERDHPDRRADGQPLTSGIARPRASG